MASKLRRRLLLTGTLLVVGVIGCLIWLTSPSEPVYHGHRLTYWMTRKGNMRVAPAQQEEVRAALECIATNNIRFLLAWLDEPDPSYAEPAYIKWLNNAFRRQHFIDVQFSQHWGLSHRGMAFQLLTELQPAAKAAIPFLIPRFFDPDRETAGVACMIVIKAGPASIPALTPLLSCTNDMARALAAGALGEIGPQAKPLMPTLQGMLLDEKIPVRLAAAGALVKLGADAELLVPVFLQCVHEGDGDSSTYALDVLGELKGRAKAAVPDLLASYAKATNEETRVGLLLTLERIAPEAAKKAKTLAQSATNSPSASQLNDPPP